MVSEFIGLFRLNMHHIRKVRGLCFRNSFVLRNID